jgi:ABC-type transport system involved in multi-copper enzyme maturation permease subunit
MGDQIFYSVVPMLFFSVQLLMPAMICGAITIEKERNTLGTLFVTRLSPLTIVLEKLASRLVPMLTFLLLTFPLLAFIYSMGGVDTTLLVSTLWLLLCECVLFASIGLLCSSWFATTAAAFTASYMLTGLILIGSVILRLGSIIPVLTPYNIWSFVFLGQTQYPDARSSWIGEMFSDMLVQVSNNSGAGVFFRVILIMSASVPSIMFAGFLLLLARIFLIRRAFISSSSALLRVFRLVDVFFTRLNDQTTGGVVLVKDYDSLPLFDPVAWRERAKKSLGKARYLFRILVVIEGPVLFICLTAATVSQTTDFSGLRALLLLVWALAAMILAMKASTAISSERTRETLEALLSTPLTAREIIEQKIIGMRRLMMVLAIPVLSIHITLLLMHFDLRTVLTNGSVGSTSAFLVYCVMSFLTTFTVMHLIAWLATLTGLRSTTQARSVMSALTTLGLWIMISVFLTNPTGIFYQAVRQFMGAESGYYGNDYWGNRTSDANSTETLMAIVGCMIRPDGGIQANEAILVASSGARTSSRHIFSAFSGSRDSAMSASLIVFFAHLGLTFLIRSVTLRLAPRLLGRNDDARQTSTEGFLPVSSVAVASEGVI